MICSLSGFMFMVIVLSVCFSVQMPNSSKDLEKQGTNSGKTLNMLGWLLLMNPLQLEWTSYNLNHRLGVTLSYGGSKPSSSAFLPLYCFSFFWNGECHFFLRRYFLVATNSFLLSLSNCSITLVFAYDTTVVHCFHACI